MTKKETDIVLKALCRALIKKGVKSPPYGYEACIIYCKLYKMELPTRVNFVNFLYNEYETNKYSALYYEHPKRVKEYKDYIKSKEWKTLRAEVIKKRGKKCERCESKHDIQAHHKTYARFMNELEEDIELLCKGCHQKEHGRIFSRKPPKKVETFNINSGKDIEKKLKEMNFKVPSKKQQRKNRAEYLEQRMRKFGY